MLINVLTFFHSNVKGQGSVQHLNVGERFDYTFSNLINYPSSMTKVSDFKGKLLILDFWNTTCSSCIESWPKLLNLQSKFDKQIQIILVNSYQRESIVRRVLSETNEKNGVDMTLPIVCRDTTLEKIFSYSGVPKVAWIDDKGIFRSFTDGTYLNEHIISAILERKPLTMHQLPILRGNSNDFLNYENSKLRNYWEAFYVNGNGTESGYMPLVSQSVLTGKIDGIMPLWSLIKDDTVHHRTTVTFHGSISSFYEVAYNDLNFLESNNDFVLERAYPNRQEWHVKDVRFFPFFPSGEANYDFAYAYQLTVPVGTPRPEIQRIIKQDLAKYFGLDARLEKRMMKCWVISVTDTALLRKKSRASYSRESGIRPVTMRNLTKHLEFNVFQFGNPVLDETGLKGKVSGFRIIEDPVLFDRELRTCGLALTLEERELEILVVSEPKGYVFPTHWEYESLMKRQWEY